MKIIVLTTLFLSISSSIYGMEYTYRLATAEDVPSLLALINEHAINDADKIVIVPRKFREAVLRKTVEDRRIFIATEGELVVAFKKLFLMSDEQERDAILKNEIRCMSSSNPTCNGMFNRKHEFVPHPLLSSPLNMADTLCIYNGADYTHPQHRNKGINPHLTNFALSSIKEQVALHLQTENIRFILMAYGLVKANSGKTPDAKPDRTPSIVRSMNAFIETIQHLRGNTPAACAEHARFQAFKPSFDPDGNECRPLDDAHAIEGFGCILRYSL